MSNPLNFSFMANAKASSSENGTSFSEVDSIVVAVGNDDDVIYSKSTALHVSLLVLKGN